MTIEFQPWHIYRGTGPTTERPTFRIPKRLLGDVFRRNARATWIDLQPPVAAIQAVNAALYLRRPVLVTGKLAGHRQVLLAESIAWDLKLGEVLRWPISSRSTVAEGVYRYDAIARLHQTQLERDRQPKDPADANAAKAPDMANHCQPGPLGTALADTSGARVLLVDELDKSDIDFPNDLLNILEDGEYEIPELARMDEPSIEVKTWKGRGKAMVMKGMLTATHFPIVVFTSNGEREFPPAFLRRCIRLELQLPFGRNCSRSWRLTSEKTKRSKPVLSWKNSWRTRKPATFRTTIC